MRKLFLFLFAALMSVGMWATTVTWNSSNLPDGGDSFSKDGVTLNCGEFEDGDVHGGGTFTSTLGNFTKIEITADNLGGGAGWEEDWDNNQMIWEGNASSVSFNGDIVGLTKIVFTIGPAAPAAPEWVRDGDEWNDDTKTLTVKSNLPNNAYKYNTEIEHVIISNSVTSIGYSAFYGCSGLTSVTIGNSVTSIGNLAFYGCSGLTSIVVANGNTTYDSRENCNAIIEKSTNTLIVGCKNTIIPNSVTSIGYSAFGGCTGLTSIEIPNSVTSIGERAFQICSGLTSITIPNGVPSIGDYTFAQCGLTSITIPNSVESIGEGAFESCSGLTSVTIGNSVTSIGDQAFVGCSGLTSITIPNSVTSIETSVFAYSGLTSIEIPNSVTSIGWYAFRNCSGLTSITIPNSVESIGEGAFYECTGLTSVTIPNSVTSIGPDAFRSCTNITDVYCYPNAANLTWYELDCNDFKDNKATVCHVNSDQLDAYQTKFNNVVNVTFEGDLDAPAVPANSCGDGLTWEYNSTTNALTISYDGTGTGAMTDFDEDHPAPWLSYRESITSVIIPDGVTSIGANAFYDCSGLTSIEIPNSVTSIGDMAFSVSGLTSITIPNSVISIGAQAFVFCSNLASIEIPNSVISIGVGAFGMCGLTSIEIPNSVEYIGEQAFAMCSGLETVTILATTPPTLGSDAFLYTAEGLKIYVPAGSEDTYKAAENWAAYAAKIVAIIIPNVDPENPAVYYSTFYDSAKKYELPEGVEAYVATIGENVLNLTKIAEAGQVIPNDNAVILKSTVTPITLTPSEADAVTFSATNDLQGTDVAKATPANCYVLSGEDGVVGFYQYSGTKLNPHKAYVLFSGSNNAPRRMPFIFDAATGVENVQGNVQSTKVLRDGQLIIIRNGVEYNANGMMVK